MMKVICYKGDQIVKTFYNVSSVRKEPKYNYYVFTQKLYHHSIVWTVRFTEVDRIELIDKDGVKKEIKI